MSKFFRPARLAALALAVSAGLASQGEALAQTPATGRTDFGVLLMAHGGSPEWDREVLAAVAPLRDRYRIEVAFGMADPVTLQAAARKLEGDGIKRIGVVRLFISGESWHERTEQILGIRPGASPRKTPVTEDPHAGHGGGHYNMELWRIESTASFAVTTEGLADGPGMGTIMVRRGYFGTTARTMHWRSVEVWVRQDRAFRMMGSELRRKQRGARDTFVPERLTEAQRPH